MFHMNFHKKKKKLWGDKVTLTMQDPKKNLCETYLIFILSLDTVPFIAFQVFC